jgi:hypothetical protein
LLAIALGGALPLVGPLRQADAVWRYFSRKNLATALATDPDKWVDADITVTDELAFVYPANPELDTEQKSKAQYVRFDTYYFHCAVETSKKGEYLDQIWSTAQNTCKDILEKIQKVNDDERKRAIQHDQAEKARHDLFWELHERWKEQPIVTLFGKVARADFFTPPFYLEGKNAPEPEAKAAPEIVTIVCEKVEKPRERFYTNLDD